MAAAQEKELQHLHVTFGLVVKLYFLLTMSAKSRAWQLEGMGPTMVSTSGSKVQEARP